MDDNACRLVQHQQVIVFKENVELRVLRFERAGWGNCSVRDIDRQHVAGRDSRRGAANGLTVYADGSFVDPRLNPAACG